MSKGCGKATPHPGAPMWWKAGQPNKADIIVPFGSVESQIQQRSAGRPRFPGGLTAPGLDVMGLDVEGLSTRKRLLAVN